MRAQQVAGIVLAATMAAGLAAGAMAQTPAPYVRVFVDNQPVTFDVPPVIMGGRVLVPLRGVFQRLGAVVAWDDTTQTVLAQRGPTNVSLRIGSTQAMVNGQPASMDVPAVLVSGRTMVPLRFVSQALGTQVAWDAASTTVSIVSQAGIPPTQAYPPSQTYPPAPPPSQTYPPVAPPSQTYPPAPPAATSSIQGTVLSVNPQGQIVVQSGGSVYTYQVTPATAISRTNASTGAGGSVALDATQPGDAVAIVASQSGVAQSIQASYAETSGIVSAISPGAIGLQNGTSYRMNPSAAVVQSNGAPAALAPGETVVLRLNPLTSEVWGVRVQQAAMRPIGPVQISPNRPLGPGDTLTVVANGPAGGIASFTIGGIQGNLPMAEQPGRPGTYVGTYTVRPGDIIQNAAVTVQISAGGQSQTASAPTSVTINGTPRAPIISSPQNGAVVELPLTVSGRAAPGSLVQVQANYTSTVLLFNVNGSLGTQTITADQNGNWNATFSQEPAVRRGLTLTITATAVDSSDHQLSPASTVTATVQ